MRGDFRPVEEDGLAICVGEVRSDADGDEDGDVGGERKRNSQRSGGHLVEVPDGWSVCFFF